MGKVKKNKVSSTTKKVSLEQQINDGQFVKPKNRVKTRLRKDNDEEVLII